MYAGHQDQRWGHISYAQHGDDLLLINLFELIGIPKPSYLDIGAHHPEIISNTALLYNRGSRGLNVDANPELIEKFKELRPEDVNLNLGVGPKTGKMPFYLFNSGPGSHGAGRNTFSEKDRDQVISEGWPVARTIDVPVITLNNLVKHYATEGKFPDLLTLDVEGFDYAILEDTMFHPEDYPKVICVEARKHEQERFKMLLAFRGYKCLIRLAENLIFIRSEFEELVR